VPANNLSFALRRAPLGASINPATGVLTWTPSPDQVPSTNLITIRVTDDGTPNLSDTKSFTVVVNEVNSAPVIGAIPNQTVNEGNSLTLTITATDANGATDTLTYNLVNPPAGAAINPATGVFTWTPSEAQGPSTNTITVQVTDNGAPPLSGTENFTVVVNEVNAMPVLAAVPNQTIDEGMTLIITNVATDVDIPANTLAFSLINPPVGASVDPNTGVFTWTLSEAQGPGSYTVRVRVTDNGSPNLSDTKSFTVTVNEVNRPPVLATIANQAVNEGSALSVAVTATDPDLPANTLTFSLGPSAPVGASIDPSTGLFTWTPTAGQAPSTNLITVKVTDNGSLSDQKNFTVVVTPPTEGLALRIRTSGNYLIISANAPLDGYDLEVKDNLSSTADWLTLPNVPVGNTFIVANDPSTKTQFYRVKQRSSSSPTLRIAISANNLVISVSGSLDGFDLQVKDSLTSSPAWTTLPNAPVGNQFIIPIDFAKKTQFYRVQQRSP
jgi:hypothetical protein